MTKIVANVRILNPVLKPRMSTFRCMVPFARGEVSVTDLKALRLEGAQATEVRFWSTWPDGSARLGVLEARVAIDSGATLDCDLVMDATPSVETGAGDVDHLLSGMLQPDTPRGDQIESVFLWGRLWAKLVLQWDTHQPVAQWWLTAGYSEPTTTDLSLTLTQPLQIALPLTAGFLAVTPPLQRPVQVAVAADGVRTVTFLPAGTVLAHGEAHAWRGTFMLDARLEATESMPLYAVATNWWEVGPAGHRVTLPPFFPTDMHLRTACEAKFNQRWSNRPTAPDFDPVYGLGKTSAETGAQDDFGVIHGNAGFLDTPQWLPIAIMDASQEWCRPTHFREQFGNAIRAAAHPNLNLWMGRPHRMISVSPDQLGKPNQDSWTAAMRAGYDAARGGWDGLDPQHTSRLLLHSTALLTADPQLMDLVHDAAEEYLLSQTLPSQKPGYFSSALDAARAVGRTCQDAAWILHLTQREDVRQRLQRRIWEVVIPAWRQTATKVVRALDIVPRVNLAPHVGPVTQPPEWHPWQEGIAAWGLWCAAIELGDDAIRTNALSIAENMVRFGWQERPGNQWQVAKAVEYTGDDVGTVTDPTTFIPADNTDYRYWVGGAVWMVRNFSMDGALSAKASSILASLQRQPSQDGFFGTFDRFVPQ